MWGEESHEKNVGSEYCLVNMWCIIEREKQKCKNESMKLDGKRKERKSLITLSESKASDESYLVKTWDFFQK